MSSLTPSSQSYPRGHFSQSQRKFSLLSQSSTYYFCLTSSSIVSLTVCAISVASSMCLPSSRAQSTYPRMLIKHQICLSSTVRHSSFHSCPYQRWNLKSCAIRKDKAPVPPWTQLRVHCPHLPKRRSLAHLPLPKARASRLRLPLFLLRILLLNHHFSQFIHTPLTLNFHLHLHIPRSPRNFKHLQLIFHFPSNRVAWIRHFLTQRIRRTELICPTPRHTRETRLIPKAEPRSHSQSSHNLQMIFLRANRSNDIWHPRGERLTRKVFAQLSILLSSVMRQFHGDYTRMHKMDQPANKQLGIERTTQHYPQS